MIKQLLSTLIAGIFVGSVYAQTAPTATTQAAAPTITDQSTTRFAAGVTTARGQATTNIIYLEQTGNAPTISINQDGKGNRAGSNASGVINSMILNGNTQIVTIDQTGDNNTINTLKVTGNAADVYLKQLGDTNSANISAGLTTPVSGTVATQSVAGTNALLDFRFTGNTNALNYVGNGPSLQAAVYVTGNGNTLNLEQQSTAGQQMLITVDSSNNNTINALQSSAGMSSLVLAQNGTGGTTFNISQTGTFSNVANISATAAGGSFNIIQRSR
jgi:hypothetical protein